MTPPLRRRPLSKADPPGTVWHECVPAKPDDPAVDQARRWLREQFEKAGVTPKRNPPVLPAPAVPSPDTSPQDETK